jgi:hypothetical protein
MPTTIDTLLVRIESDMSDLKRDLSRIEKTTEKTTNSMQKSFKRVGAAMAALGGAAAATSLVKSFIKTGAEIENLAVRFNTLFGSVDQGAIAFQAITKYASQVPFSLEDIQRGAAPLATVAKDANMMGDALLLTGNIAAASGLSFEEASQNIQRALSAGINSAELFRERGVSAMAGFQAGTTYNVEETLEKLQAAFGAGGEFDGITNDLAKTTDGALSMLGDSLFTFRRTVAESGANEGFKELIAEIKTLVDRMRPFASMIGTILGTAFKGLAVTIRFVINLFEELKATMLLLMAVGLAGAVKTMTSAMIRLARVTLLNRNLFAQLTAIVKKNPFVLFAVGATFLAEKTGLVSKALEELEERFPNFFGGLADAAASMSLPFDLGMNKLNEELSNALRVPLSIHIGQDDPAALAEERLTNLKALISGTVTPTEELAENIGLLEDHLKEAGDNALPLASEALERLKHQMASAEPMMQSLNTAVASMAAGISSSFADALVDGKLSLDSLKDIFSGFVKTILAKAIELFVVNAIMNAIFGGVEGYEMLPVGKIGNKAGGGTVQPRTPVLVGERGPELFVPSGAGAIMNNMNTNNALSGAGGTVVNQTINISTGVAQTVRTEVQSMLPQIAEASKMAVLDARRRGGNFASAF